MNWMRSCLLTCTLLMVATTGCQSLLTGGPKPVLTDAMLEGVQGEGAKSELTTLLDATDTTARNGALLKLLARTDVRYSQFRREVMSGRKHSRAITSGLDLAADVAATLTTSVGVKNNYIALSSLLQGGEGIIDKEYLLGKTMDALLAQMDASRMEKRVVIQLGMGRNIDAYPGQLAMADLVVYHQAGTIDAAIIDIQRTASIQEAKSANQLRDLEAISDDELTTRSSQTTRINKFVRGLDSNQLVQLRGYLQGKGIAVPVALTLPEQTNAALKGMIDLRSRQILTFDQLVKELVSAGFPSP